MVGANINIEKARLFLTTPYVSGLEVTTLVDNWKDWQVVVKRDRLSATAKETTFPFRFVRAARTALKQVYDTYLQNGEATLVLWKEWNGNVPTVSITYDLDFGTYMLDDDFVEIACREQDIRSITKKHEGTEYSVPIAEVALGKHFKYERVTLDNKLVMRRANFAFQHKSQWNAWRNSSTRWYGFTFQEADTPVKDYLTYTDIADGDTAPSVTVTKKGIYTVAYVSEADIVNMSVWGAAAWVHANKQNTFVRFDLFVGNNVVASNASRCTYYDNDVPQAETFQQYLLRANTVRNNRMLSWTGLIEAGQGIRVNVTWGLYGTPPTSPSYGAQLFNFCGVGRLEVSYRARVDEVLSLPCTNLKRLLESLYAKMGVKTPVNVTVSDTLARDIIFIPASVLTNEQERNITISYSKLKSFLSSIACALHIDGSNVYVRPVTGANGIYNRNEAPAFTFSETECADLVISADVENTFSEIRIGNSGASSLEGVNAQREFNMVHTYTSNANTKNSLDLTSSVRTDSIGFEFSIVNSRMNKRKSSSNNKDLFAVHVEDNGKEFVVHPTEVNYLPSDMFNGALSPQALIRRWKPVWSSFADVLKLSANESNRIIVNGIGAWNTSTYESGGVYIPELLPVTYDIATSDDKDLLTREWVSGTVEFNYKGQTYKGFVNEAQENPLLRNQKELKLTAVGRTINYPLGLMLDRAAVNINGSPRDMYFAITITGMQPQEQFTVGERQQDSDWMRVMGVGDDQELRTRGVLSIELEVFVNNTGVERVGYIEFSVQGKTLNVLKVTQAPTSQVSFNVPTLELSDNGEFTDNLTALTANVDVAYPSHIEWWKSFYGSRTVSADPFIPLWNLHPQVILSFELDVAANVITCYVFGTYDIGGTGLSDKSVYMYITLLGENVLIPIEFKTI